MTRTGVSANESGRTRIESNLWFRIEASLPSVGMAILRYGTVFFLLLFGAAKWTAGEAQGIQNWMSHNPLTSWLYGIFGLQGASIAIGVVEVGLALAILTRRFLPRVSAWGSLLSTFMFLTTLTFLFTTPKDDETSKAFLMKDLILLGAAVATSGEAFRAARLREGKSA